MKNYLKIILLLFFSLAGSSQVITFQDNNFKMKLLSANVNNQVAGTGGFSVYPASFISIDANGNGEIEQSEVLQVTFLDVKFSNIYDLTGLEYFTNLRGIWCNNNHLTTFQFPQLSQLEAIQIFSNNLTSITLTGLVALRSLRCYNNQLTTIDFSGLPNLKIVGCQYNQLSSLDFSSNPLFYYLICNNNQLTSINIKNGYQQLFYNTNDGSVVDCWGVGNFFLTNVCTDDFEVASCRSFLDGCGSHAIGVDSSCALANDVFGFGNEISVYPNPTSSIVNINYNSIIKSVTLYDTLGRLLLSQEVNQSNFVLDISNQNKGIYLLKIVTENGSSIEKIVKE